MKDNNIKLLLMWYHKSKLYYHCHRDSSKYFDFYHKIIELPAIMINIFNTTSLFSTYKEISPSYALIIAILSLISGILIACQNYFKLDELKYQHTRLMIQYSKLLLLIEKIIIFVKNDDTFILTHDKIDSILNGFETLREEFYYFPSSIWKKNNSIFKLKLNNLDLETSDSINAILESIKNKKNFSLDESSKDDNKVSEIITYTNNEKHNVISEGDENNNKKLPYNSNIEEEITVIKIIE